MSVSPSFDSVSPPPPGPSHAHAPHARHRIAPLPLLTVINFFNYLDRQMVYGLFPIIGRDMQLSYTQLGALGFGNLLVFALSSILAGPITDRFGPRRTIFAGVAVWSLATVGSALAPNFAVMMLMRALVGVGEGAFGPSANALLCADAPPDRRGRAMGIYNVGMALGGATGALAILVDGILKPYISWRGVMMLAGAPGILLAIAALGMAAPERVPRDPRLKARQFLLAPSYVIALLGGILGTFGCGALITWLSTLLMQEHGFPANLTGPYIFGMAAVCGGGGVLVGGYVGDALNRRRPGGHALTVGLAFLLAVPFCLSALFVPGKIVFSILTALTGFLLSVYNGPVAAVVDDLGPRQYAATLQAWFLLGIHLLGNTPQPIVTGWICDQLKTRIPNPVTFALLPAVAAFAACGILFSIVARRQRLAHEAADRAVAPG